MRWCKIRGPSAVKLYFNTHGVSPIKMFGWNYQTIIFKFVFMDISDIFSWRCRILHLRAVHVFLYEQVSLSGCTERKNALDTCFPLVKYQILVLSCL